MNKEPASSNKPTFNKNPSHPLFIYVHIPYCEKRCTYCDFTIFEKDKALPSSEYISLLKQEISNKKKFFKEFRVETIYFGGGTPSLIPSEELTQIIQEIKSCFFVSPTVEITLEVNPGNLTKESFRQYQAYGVNRFSLGVQTFNSWFLKESGRSHGVKDSLRDLTFFQENHLNFSVDLMFGLPHQTLSKLKKDLKTVSSFCPPHISLYNLTVPKNHTLSNNRATETTQAEMFQLIKQILKKKGLKKYELSNFAREGFHSRHNSAYWNGSSFLGLGVSAHSYLSPLYTFPGFSKNRPYGLRFWNSRSLSIYKEQALAPCSQSPIDNLPLKQTESLKLHEALTDFCHTRLRTTKGLSEKELTRFFPEKVSELVLQNLSLLTKNQWLKQKYPWFSLTEKGEVLSNQVFLNLTFLEKNLSQLIQKSPLSERLPDKFKDAIVCDQ
ncbi:MAG: radical SAM family heme chaperone HemW [Bdellovibrionales bacterium]|nr:radical SAM family heme chaperone HemW [Bdellovibrionales bacterium]